MQGNFRKQAGCRRPDNKRDTVIISDGSGTIEIRGPYLSRKLSADRSNDFEQKESVEIKFTTNTIGEIDYLLNSEENLDDPNTLIPILLRKDTFPVLYGDIVFWFVPGEELFRKLPEAIGTQVRDEYSHLKAMDNKEQKNSSCVYFEVCKSTWSLENLKIYPNPAKSNITIEFTLKDEIPGTVSLMNSAGVLLRQLAPKSRFNSGYNSFSINLEGIVPGMYLIAILSEKGFVTQRLIISR